MLVLGLTGNIGCGKSSLSNIFIKNNIDVIDADIISRNIFEDKDILEKVFYTFGDSIKNDDETLNRKLLGNIVFNNDNELIKLNNITHPKIKENILNDIKECKKMKKEVVVIDAALLVEANYLDIIDKLLVVTCSQEIQVDRVIKRDKCTYDEAMSRINSQMPQNEKSKYADYIIDNSKDIIYLEDEAEKFIMYMKENWYG